MNRIANVSIHATFAFAAYAGMVSAALAQSTASGPQAPMVKPPPTAVPGAASATNPDNMPVKKPRKPTNDKMMHDPPASASNAK